MHGATANLKPPRTVLFPATAKLNPRELKCIYSIVSLDPKLTLFLSDIKSYLPLKHQDHCMSRKKATKTRSFTAVLRSATRRPKIDLDLLAHISNITDNMLTNIQKHRLTYMPKTIPSFFMEANTTYLEKQEAKLVYKNSNYQEGPGLYP